MAIFSVVLFTAPPSAGMDGGGALVKIDGREALLRSVELFLNRDNVKQIQLVVTQQAMEEAKRKYGGHLGFSGVKLIAGGPSWIDQLAAAGQNISAECTHVLVHDAARPAVAYSDLEAIMAEAEKHPVVALAAPLRTTVAEIDESGELKALHPPQRFMQVVTPWTLKKDRFLDMAKSKREPSPGEITLLKGSSLNVRVGHPADASLVRAMIAMLPKPKIRGPENPFEEAQW